MAAIDWTHIFLKYPGLWVGLKDDEKTVIASGKTVKEVMEKAKRKKYPKPILLRVPSQSTYYIGGPAR